MLVGLESLLRKLHCCSNLCKILAEFTYLMRFFENIFLKEFSFQVKNTVIPFNGTVWNQGQPNSSSFLSTSVYISCKQEHISV